MKKGTQRRESPLCSLREGPVGSTYSREATTRQIQFCQPSEFVTSFSSSDELDSGTTQPSNHIDKVHHEHARYSNRPVTFFRRFKALLKEIPSSVRTPSSNIPHPCSKCLETGSKVCQSTLRAKVPHSSNFLLINCVLFHLINLFFFRRRKSNAGDCFPRAHRFA